MQLDLIKVIQFYMYGVVRFSQDVQTSKGVYKKNTQIRVTPALIWLIASGEVPVNTVKLVVRQLHQIEDKEVRELAAIAINGNVNNLAKVTRQGIGKAYTIECHINDETSIVIDSVYNVAIAEKLILPNVHPIITLIAPKNQTTVQAWFLSKYFDVYKLMHQGNAIGEKNWGLDYYDKIA